MSSCSVLPGLLVGLVVGVCLSVAWPVEASRNAGGTYSLPAGNPVVSGTTITSTWANNTLSDLASEMTASLDRNGKGAMLAPLQLVSSGGTVSAPALAFSGDTNTGLYRVAADQLAVACGGSQMQSWTSTASTINVGLIVTEDTANTAGTTSTGNGTGAGVSGVGGATGVGVHGTGGGSSASGVLGTGSSPNGAGVAGSGSGTGAGVSGTGGSTSGHGVTGTGGAPNGVGVNGLGDGTGSGVAGTGGDNGGYGVYGTGGATGGAGVRGDGNGSGAGGYFGAGTASDSTTRYAAINVSNGDVAFFDAVNPASTTSVSNALTPMGLIKAWGRLTGTTPTVTSGANIASASCAANKYTVTIAGDMANTSYAVLCTPGVATIASCYPESHAAGSFVLAALDFAGAAVNLCAGSESLSFLVLGAQ